MTKRDYQAIARAIHGTRPTCEIAEEHVCGNEEALEQWRFDRDALAHTLAADNPRFNRALFIEACETGKCKGMKA